MTETTNGAAAPSGSAEGQAVPMTVNLQFVKDLSFENPNAPQSLVNTGKPPAVEVNVNVAARGLSPSVYEVMLSINATAKNDADVVFVVELTYGGIFTLNGVPSEHVHPVLLIECPRLLFPFARAIIADSTRDGGFPPLLIQPIDFVDLYRKQAMAQQAAQAAGGTTTA